MRTILITLLLCSSALAQDTVVTDTSIKVGTMLTCPRFSTLYANKLVVPAETTVTLPASFDYDAIEVSGTLKLSRDYDTTGRVIVIQVLPGGSLDFGTASDPVLRKVDIQIKDSPLLTGTDGNLGPDPEQFGNGVLVFGEWVSHGKPKTGWTFMQPVNAGALQVTVADSAGWEVGDYLLFYDTAQQQLRFDAAAGAWLPPAPPRRESRKVASISGNTITLDAPLAFEHLAYKRPDTNESVQLPPVSNITHNIVIRSENPQGVRGHTMFMGSAHVNLYYTAFLGLGRTLPKTLDNFNSHTGEIGENQVARYAVHWHHVHGHADAQGLTGRLVGCYGDGTDIAKWFAVQHGTHDLLIQGNVGDRFVGSSFITEDGFEVRGHYLQNLAGYSKGVIDQSNFFHSPLPNQLVDPAQLNNPGAEGAGFWFHGSAHEIKSNVSINNVMGYQHLHMSQVGGRAVPSEPGGPNDTTPDPRQSIPIAHSNNLALSNLNIGVDEWQLPPAFWLDNCGALGNAVMAYHNGEGQPNQMNLRNCRSIGGSVGVHGSAAYADSLVIEGGYFLGHDRAVTPSKVMALKNTLLGSTRINLDVSEFAHRGTPIVLDNVQFTRLAPDAVDVVLGQGATDPVADWNLTRLVQVLNWKQTGKDYWFIENVQAPANAVALDGLVNAKAELIGGTLPTISPITASPPDVDPVAPGVQEYVGPVTYSVTANGPVTWFYSVNGGPRTQYATGDSITFTYQHPVNYVWYAVNGTAESSLAVQVISQPATDAITIKATLPDGKIYEGSIPRK